MKLWPYERFEVDSPLSLDDVTKALRFHTLEPEQYKGVFGIQRRFIGRVAAEGFKIRASSESPFTNIYRPVIEGTFADAGSGVRIAMTMRPMWISIIWIGLVFAALLGGMVYSVAIGSGAIVGLLLPIMICAWGLVLAMFWVPAHGAKVQLTRILREPAPEAASLPLPVPVPWKPPR